MLNIPDVPFTVGSGGKKDQIMAFQQKDAVIIIFADNFKKGVRQLIFFFCHFSEP
jgi:ribosomal protein L30E